MTPRDIALSSPLPGEISMTTLVPPARVTAAASAPGEPPRIQRLLRGRPGDPRWARPALCGLLAVTAALYLGNLSASGYANAFYSAAVQAGTQSWKAFFFGSSDASNFITIDKPPAALWVMELSARVFGVNSWSILVPEALMGVATAGVLYATIRRWFGPAAGLIAGTTCALTPVAAMMFTFNNPDALLVLLLTVAAYALTRAIEDGRTRWLVLAAALVGTGFITKMLQAFLVLPAFAATYLLTGPHTAATRVRQLLVSGVALAVATLWWPVAVSLVPAADRPYVGGSQNNSIWNLIFGYNGFGRLTGNETGSVGGGGGNGGAWGPTGWNRLFTTDFGGQISWLIPGALVLLVGALALGWRAGRTDRTRAALGLWGGSLVVTGLTFSYASGIIHPYYTVALAPAVGALVGIGAVVLWRQRSAWVARAVLGLALAVTAWWAYRLLARSPDWNSWLRPVVLVAGLAAAIALMPDLRRRIGGGVASLGLTAALAAPLAFTLDTVNTAHTGAIPSAGPTVSVVGGFAGQGPGGAGFGGFAGQRRAAGPQGPAGWQGRPGAGGAVRGAGGPGAGGLLNASTSNPALTAALRANASHYTWVAATTGSNNASGYQLASGQPVMAIGGFNGSDPAPTLAQFERFVAAKKIHYYIPGGTGRPGGSGSSDAAQIESWVTSHFTAATIGEVTVYDLTTPATGTTSG